MTEVSKTLEALSIPVALRTPEEHFADLPDFPYAARGAEDLPGYEGLRMVYLDEAPTTESPRNGGSGRTALCLHGQPTWSYLYRKMIPALRRAGYRVVAPDLFGFGRSDKPVDDKVYTFDFHRGSLLAFVERLDLRKVTLVCHDWGGILGLTLPMDLATPEGEDRVERLLVMNTALGTGDYPLSEGFLAWRDWVAANPDLAVGRLMKRACPRLTDAEVAAYDAPFPDAVYKAGVRRFPQLVPDRPDAPGADTSRRARDFWAERWSGRSVMVVGLDDPVLGAGMKVLHGQIKGCPVPLEIAEAGHFVPEWGDHFVQRALSALG